MLKSTSAHAQCVVLATTLWLLCGSAPAIAQISFVAASAPLPSSSAVSSVSAGPPAGLAANDMMLAAISYRGGNAMGSAPSGWTVVTSAGGGQNVVTYVYRKVATASEPASYTWTLSSSDRATVVILAFRGVDTSSPVAASSQNYSGSNSTSLVALQVTPGVADSMLVAFWAVTNGNGTITPPSSMTERFNLSTGAGPNGLVLEGATESYAPATATGTRTATSSLSEQYGAILLALRPRCGPTFTVTNTNNSGAGSLRQAITDANSCPGTDTIAFNVSGAGCSGGVCTISPTSALPAITDPVIIDGRTQPGYAGTPLVRVDGASASGSDGLRVNANSSTIAGLMITRFGQLGLNLTASNCVVIANYIGTNGTSALGNSNYGINVQGSSNTIGSTSAAGRNLISGNLQSGIVFTSGSTNLVLGNWIGLDAFGGTLGNSGPGITIDTGTGNTVGGTVSGAGNVIAGNTRGVQIAQDGATGHAILGNSMYANTGLGIDLGSTGVYTNNGSKTSGKPNLLMNSPVFTSASLSGTTLTVAGYVGSAAGQSVFGASRVEIFISDNDASGFGEGRTYLGFLTTDSNGNFAGALTGVTGITTGTTPVTATATDGANNTSEFGRNFVVTSAPPPVAPPGGFAAFETSTPGGAITGVIKTKIADTTFTLALVALNSAGTAVHTTFTGTLTVELLDASNNSGALNTTTNCRSTWAAIQALSPNPSFTAPDNGRINVSFTQPNAWRDVRVRATTTGAAPVVIGCSTDNFAIRPATFASLQATDATDSTPGVTRVLDNTNELTGVVHRAGRQFSVLAQARSSSGAATAGYSGTPGLNVVACVSPAGCAAGTLTSALSGVAGSVSGSASYSEAGVISVLAEDLAFANVDGGDSSVDERAIRSATTSFGRFVADNYDVTVANVPTLSPGACAAGGTQTFTFLDQPFAFAVPPQLLVVARNAANQPIANARPRFAVPHVTATLAATLALSALSGDPVIASVVHSPSLVSLSTSSFRFARDAATPVASFTPALRFNATVTDTTEPGATAPITGTLAAPYGPLAFSSGVGQLHYGRAVLRPVFGDIRRELLVPLEIQRFNGTGWVALSDAGNCLIAAANTFAYSDASGALAASGTTPNCASRVTAAVATSNGRAAINLPRPGPLEALVPAAMTVTLNVLGAASGQTCSGVTLTPAATLNMPWLAAPDSAGSHSANPRARLTWGRQRGDFLMLRERFD